MKSEVTGIGIRVKTAFLKTDLILESEITNTLRFLLENKNSKKRITAYLENIFARFKGLEKETLNYIITDLKRSYGRYRHLEVYRLLDYYIIVYKVYADTAVAAFRVVILFREEDRPYVVIERIRLYRDIDRDIDDDQYKQAIIDAVTNVTPYDYEIDARKAYIEINTPLSARSIRVQGDLLWSLRVLLDKEVFIFIEQEVKLSLLNIINEDLIMWLSRYLIENGIENRQGINRIRIGMRYSEYDIRKRLQYAIEEILSRYLGTPRRYMKIEVYRETDKYNKFDTYEIRAELNSVGYLDLIFGQDYINELIDNAKREKEYSIYVGNHIVKGEFLNKEILIDTELPFTGRRIHRLINVGGDAFIMNKGEKELLFIHNEHGENDIIIRTTCHIHSVFSTISKGAFHRDIRSRIALLRLVERYAKNVPLTEY